MGKGLYINPFRALSALFETVSPTDPTTIPYLTFWTQNISLTIEALHVCIQQRLDDNQSKVTKTLF